ncbi:hypothetical protein ACK3YF_00915 [Aeromonas allosaccharophila]|uniref:hypothetical protein n=1 Tax=Aeromonas allosaccharophila TaxID=656 RepID=UPI0039874875
MNEQQELISQLFNHAAISLAEGKSMKSVVAEFVDKGVPLGIAENIVAQANKYKKEEFRKGGLKTLGIGVALLAFGGVITAVTYSAAGPGGTYVITSGLFLVGAITILRGLWRTMVG